LGHCPPRSGQNVPAGGGVYLLSPEIYATSHYKSYPKSNFFLSLSTHI